jgi:hypothetical protein
VNKKRKLPILSILQAGNPGFDRWAIADERNRLWTGEGFGFDGQRLYASYNAAAWDIQQILRAQCQGIEPVYYVAPLVIEVFADPPVHEAKVSLHLSNSVRLYMNTPEHGHGPEGSLILSRIDWSQMEQTSNPNDEEFPA